MKQLEKKHPLAIRWFHWINFPVLMVMMWSGILIYWANDVYRVGLGSTTLFKFFPPAFYEKFSLAFRLAEGMAWHFVFAWVFAINGTLYVLYVALSGEWRYLLPKRETLREAIQVVLHDLRIRREPLPRAKFNGAQRIAYSSVMVMGLGSLLTGLAIYKPVQTAGILPWLSLSIMGATGYEISRFLHFWLTMAFCGFFLIHVLQVARAGWNNFRAMVTGYEVVPAEADSDQPTGSAPVPTFAPRVEAVPTEAASVVAPVAAASVVATSAVAAPVVAAPIAAQEMPHAT